MVGAVDRFHDEHAGGPVALCVHDWGGLIGLRWACDHPEKVSALIISATGFFPDGKWHGFAQVLKTEGQGEAAVEAVTREGFGQMIGGVAPGIDDQSLDEYFKAYADPVRRRGQLELYRSGDFAELEPYRGRLAALNVPTLLLFGSDDPFAPVAGAHRLAREIPRAQLEILDGVGHFLFDVVPDRASGIVSGRAGARCRRCRRSVSPTRPPNRTCPFLSIRLSTGRAIADRDVGHATAAPGRVVAWPVPVVAHGEGMRWPRYWYRVTGTSAGQASLAPSGPVQWRPQYFRLICFQVSRGYFTRSHRITRHHR